MKIYKEKKLVGEIDKESIELTSFDKKLEEMFNKYKKEGIKFSYKGEGYSEEKIVDAFRMVPLTSESFGLLELQLNNYGYKVEHSSKG